MALAVTLALPGLIWAAPARAASPDEEIRALIDAVATSDCDFIRNGKIYDAARAADHLRLKYRRGRKYADTTERFIERLASRSSISKKPYYMQCDAQPRIEAGRWLSRRLATLRTE